MKSILNAITNRLQAQRNAKLSDAELFTQLIGKASKAGGELPDAEAEMLIEVAERRGINAEQLEAKVQFAIAARTRFDEMIAAMKKMPEIAKRRQAASDAAAKARKHFEDVTAKAKADMEAAETASSAAYHEESQLGKLAFELDELFVEAGEFLPTPTPEVDYFRSGDFEFGRPPDKEKDYSNQNERARRRKKATREYVETNDAGLQIAPTVRYGA